jgi:hypothetical protein
MICSKNIALYTGCLGLPPREDRSGPEAGKTSTFILYIFPAVSYRGRLQSCHFRVTKICVAADRQSSQGLKLLSPLRLPVPPSRPRRLFHCTAAVANFEYGHAGSGLCTGVATSGNSTRKIAPSPGWLSTPIEPRCWVTIHCAMARPRPAPPWARFRALSTR